MATEWLKLKLGQLYQQLTLLSRPRKRVAQITFDSLAVAFAVTSTWLLNDVFQAGANWGDLLLAASLSALVIVGTLHVLGTYKTVVRYMTTMYAARLALAAFAVAVTAIIATSLTVGNSRFDLFSDFFASVLVLTSGPRYLLRWAANINAQREISVVYGAGAAGRQLASALSSSDEYQVIAFVDDAATLKGANVLGLPVLAADQLDRLVANRGVTNVLLALPSVSRSRRREIVSSLEHLSVRVRTIPGMLDLISGGSNINELQEVSIDDLLGRDSVQPNPALISANTTGKSVMITGAGGSIGSELARQALLQKPKQLVLYELSEFALYSIDADLRERSLNLGFEVEIIPVLGTVRDGAHLRSIMTTHGVQTVYHAAAYKHVPLVEHNPIAGLANNVLGTWECAKAAIASDVEVFVLISTDKAVRPTNVMGASKRFSELGIQALARTSPTTKLSMVRFGNVLGSSGSVVPKFRKQIKAGDSITVTHPDITRYFMTIPEAAQLVIQAGALGTKGEVFILDMGEPVRIVDLAKRIIRLSGLQERTKENPGGDIEIRFTGLRPGEKLYEELLIDDAEFETIHERIMVSGEPSLPFEEYKKTLHQFEIGLQTGDLKSIRELLLDLPIAWTPDSEAMYDHSISTEKRSVLRAIA